MTIGSTLQLVSLVNSALNRIRICLDIQFLNIQENLNLDCSDQSSHQKARITVEEDHVEWIEENRSKVHIRDESKLKALK